MNKFFNKMERKYGRYAIKNLVVYLLAAYAIGYVLFLMNPTMYSYIELNPAMVMRGQIWRLVTWVCTVPESFSFFLIFMFIFQYFIGSALEKAWGSFRYNCYIISGILFMTISTMVIYWAAGISMSPSTYYICMASFLAFAVCFPDLQVYFMMIIPIKVKWMAIADLVYLAYEFIAVGQYREVYAMYGAAGLELANQLIWATRVGIVVSLLNFFIFYLSSRNVKRFSPKEIHRRQTFKKSTVQPFQQTKHKCAICGRTEKDGVDLVFRFCSKCNGNYEFCQEHLYTHQHFK